MIIDSLTNTSMYIEKKVPIEIFANSTINNNGILEVDNNKNNLISPINIGDNILGVLKEYNGIDSVMFYSPINKQICLAKQGDKINIKFDYINGIKYFIGARKIVTCNPVNYVFNCDLTGVKVFKIFADTGREIKNYIVGAGKLTVKGKDRLYIDDFTEITIYVYKQSQLKGTQTYFRLQYDGYSIVYDKNLFISHDYFKVFKGIEVKLFDSLELSQSIIKDTNRDYFQSTANSIVNSVENSIDLQTFIGSGEVDLPIYVGKDEFRIILISQGLERVVLINNCGVGGEGISLIYAKDRNSKKYKISCGNYIEIGDSEVHDRDI